MRKAVYISTSFQFPVNISSLKDWKLNRKWNRKWNVPDQNRKIKIHSIASKSPEILNQVSLN